MTTRSPLARQQPAKQHWSDRDVLTHVEQLSLLITPLKPLSTSQTYASAEEWREREALIYEEDVGTFHHLALGEIDKARRCFWQL